MKLAPELAPPYLFLSFTKQMEVENFFVVVAKQWHDEFVVNRTKLEGGGGETSQTCETFRRCPSRRFSARATGTERRLIRRNYDGGFRYSERVCRNLKVF